MPDVKVTSIAREAVLQRPPRAMRRIRSIRTRIANGLGWLRVGLCRLMSPPVTIHTSKMDQWQKLSLSLSGQ